ncbi:pirin family protein [Pseudomonas sp. BJa5]|uniref:pirin family protein n=1 Tax=Pseudomonas sp. BJa5 TaxID=2936270 RepID=UPI002559E29C|nr:pirin family protein [Pseudomonas sp. BGr12]MDL2422997.1 pirin family protein [Pseudomonas sp. BGr12]
MSTHETRSELSSSYDCPIVEGNRAIQRIASRSAEVGGGLPVNRVLPSRHRRMVGAWCFLDHAGPAVFKSGDGLRVGPHPHIGLQTFTWMIEGQVMHRDSLGNEQLIRPGEVNLMTAGHGIAHTEVSLPGEDRLHAVQLWIALPNAERDRPPSFTHHGALPSWQADGMHFTLLAGRFAGQQSPAKVFSELVGLDLAASTGGGTRLTLEPGFEYAVLPLTGEWLINGEAFAADELAYLGRGLERLELESSAGARAVLVGGVPFSEEIFIWWNFVGHSKAEIAQAQDDWEQGRARFPEVAGFDGPRLVAPALPWRP